MAPVQIIARDFHGMLVRSALRRYDSGNRITFFKSGYILSHFNPLLPPTSA